MQGQYSDSEDSDDAPEEVSVSTAKKHVQLALEKARSATAKQASDRKAKARSADAKRKAAKKGKAKLVETVAPSSDDDGDDDDDADERDEGDDSEEEGKPVKGKKTTFPVASTSTYLDPALFASAAAHFAPAAQPAPGTGKGAAKRAAKEDKRAKREREEERSMAIKEGDAVSAGGVTIQHIAAPTYNPTLTSTALPSHTKATKFLNSRLYSKKRILAISDASHPAPPSEKKRKKGAGGGMSEESKMLLGLGMDDGAREVSEEAAKEKEKQRKKALLLQAEGRRKSATLARPLASARRGSRPASNFAVATRTN